VGEVSEFNLFDLVPRPESTESEIDWRRPRTSPFRPGEFITIDARRTIDPAHRRFRERVECLEFDHWLPAAQQPARMRLLFDACQYVIRRDDGRLKLDDHGVDVVRASVISLLGESVERSSMYTERGGRQWRLTWRDASVVIG
jgi:hypothetical protein